MFKNLSKMEKVGLAIGAIECIAGFGMAIYASYSLGKRADDIIQNIKDTTPNFDNIDFSVSGINVDDFIDED